MKSKINIEESQDMLKKYLKTPNLLDHSRETEVIMRALAKHFGEDEDHWGITGLLHDMDLDEIGEDLAKHGKGTCELLAKEGYDLPEMFQAIKAHTEGLGFLGVKRTSKLDYCLAAAENTAGLIYAYALMRPDKTLEGAKIKSLTKKFKDKSFAAKVDRGLINDIENAGMQRSEFFEIALNAMKSISSEIGL